MPLMSVSERKRCVTVPAWRTAPRLKRTKSESSASNVQVYTSPPRNSGVRESASWKKYSCMASLPAEHFHIREHASGRGVPDADDLVGLALATERGTEHIHRVALAGHLQVTPEGGGHAAVIRVLDHGGQLPVLDPLPPLAAELEFVARIVDGPRQVGLHVHPAFHCRHHLGKARGPGFEVEVGHAVDGRSVPTGGARVRHPGQASAGLRADATQAAQQDAVADEVFAAGKLALVVEGVAGELLGPGGIKGNVEQVRAVAVAAEHVRGDEAGAGVVALVA